MEALNLILVLGERFGLMVGAVFLLFTIMPVQQLHHMPDRFNGRTAMLTLLFGVFGILGTYTGNSVFGSVANLRAMVVITAGLFGGPVVGVGSGLIAGTHRLLTDIDGFSAWPCGLATALEGVAAGIFSYRMREKAMDWRIAGGVAIMGETVHMLLLLLLSRPFDEALALVKIIAPPMLLVNTIGAALFVEVINLFSRDRERRESLHAQLILDIANTAVSYLRMGLSPQTAESTANIIHFRLGVSAVAITDTKNVLAHVGDGSDHHLPGHEIRTSATKYVLETGEPVFVSSSEEIGCNHPNCPMRSAIIVPLTKNSEIIGSLKLYGSSKLPLNATLFEVGKGLGNLFSTQLELKDIEIKGQMLAHAEIRRLQAQINPHFLFNSLNTIASFYRTNAEKARELLIDLSLYMRRNLDLSRGFIPLSEELEQVRSYLAIEKARFGQRIAIDMDIPDEAMNWPIPPLIIQPLIENSIRHGLLPRKEGGAVRLSAARSDGNLEILVADDGMGIDDETLQRILTKDGIDSCHDGIGMRNCLSRLEHIYGPEYSPSIQSEPGKGTQILMRIPRQH